MRNCLLIDDHEELGEILAGVFAALDTGDLRRIFDEVDIFWARLAMHIRAEHLHLFPAILKGFESDRQKGKTAVPSIETVKTRIEQLREDHNFFMNELAAAIKQMRKLSESSQTNSQKTLLLVREKIAVVGRRLKKHNELEEAEVYTWADKTLNQVQRAVLNEKMQKELENLPPRFSRL